MSIIEVKSLTVRLGARTILDKVSFEVESGVTMLLGRNGSGKSTLIRALNGLIPSKGDIIISGHDMRSMNVRERARTLSYLPQRQTIPEGTTLIDYVLMGAAPSAGLMATPGKSFRKTAMHELEKLGLTGMQSRLMTTLSGGEARLAALARTRMLQSKITLMDEPLAGLDYYRQHEFLSLAVSERRPVLMSMHDPALAWQYGDRLLILDNGSVTCCHKGDEKLFSDTLNRIYGDRLRFEQAGSMRLPIWHNE